jgi:hypothetical protein
MYTEYRDKYGAFPAIECEPTIEQLSAMNMVAVALDKNPWVDFGVFGPHGKRILKKLTFVGYVDGPSGTVIRKELSGPPSIEVWRKCWRTYRTMMLMLKLITAESLDSYSQKITDLSEKYPSLWWLTYQADYRMRSEMWERIRLETELRRSSLATIDPAVAQSLVPYDASSPWDSVCAASVGRDYADFWIREVNDKAVALQTRQLTMVDARASDTGVTLKAADDVRDDMPWQRGEKREAARPSKQKPQKAAKSFSPCRAFNTADGCTNSQCQYDHVCSSAITKATRSRPAGKNIQN